MPTYEFRCPQGHSFDKFYRKISDAVSEIPCPECGAMAQRQLSGGAGLLFKGSGFYLTDYGKNAHRSSAPSSDAKSDSTEKKGAESKPKDAAVKPAESSSGGASGGGEKKKKASGGSDT